MEGRRRYRWRSAVPSLSLAAAKSAQRPLVTFLTAEFSESLVAPPGPRFGHEPPVVMCLVSVDVVQKVKGHTIAVTGTDAADQINCGAASLKVHVSAGKGNDNVAGSAFDDVISGGKGCDAVRGGVLATTSSTAARATTGVLCLPTLWVVS